MNTTSSCLDFHILIDFNMELLAEIDSFFPQVAFGLGKLLEQMEMKLGEVIMTAASI